MQPNPLLGVVFHWLGGLASGSFYVPCEGVRKWSWETFRLAGGGMFSWFICASFGTLVPLRLRHEFGSKLLQPLFSLAPLGSLGA